MPPEADTVAEPKLPQVIEKVLKERVGVGLIATLVCAEAVQFREVPITSKVPFDAGLSVKVLVVNPLLQEYVLAPLAENVIISPGQIKELFKVAVTLGVGLTL